MPTLANDDTENTVQEQVRRYVQVKDTWAGTWILLPYVDPIQARQLSGPGVGEADVGFDFGNIKWENLTAFAQYPDLVFNDLYVRFLIQRPNSLPKPVWYGIFADTQSTLISSAREGYQEAKAFELSHLLDRTEIQTSWVKPTRPLEDNEDEDEREVVEINSVQVFNERIKGDSILGNRSAEKSESDETPKTWYFDYSNGVPWSAYNVVEYLLKRLAPDEITWELVDLTESDNSEAITEEDETKSPLKETFAIWDFRDNKTIWQCLEQLIRRDRGLGFYLRVQPGSDPRDQDQTVELVVYSITDEPYNYGAYELPANSNQVFLGLPGDTLAHLIGEIPFRQTATTQYDTIEVVGERFLSTATFAVLDSTLEKGWSEEEESAYKLGISADEEENDQYRASEYFQAVYSHFKVPTEWDLKAGGAEIGYDYHVAVPAPLDNGDYNPTERGEFWNYGKEFERELPFYPNFSYDDATDSPTAVQEQLDALTYTPELRPLLVGIRFAGDTEPSAKYVAIDRLQDVDETLVNPGQVGVLEGAMGINLQFSPRHYLALNHFDPDTDGGTFYDPELDWEDLFVTAMFETDDRPKIVLQREGGTPAEVEKKLRIEVPGAEYWWVSKSTVVDIDYEGKLVHYLDGQAEGLLQYIRYDKPKLEAVASFAAAWYGPKRQAITIPIKELGQFVPIGSLLTDIRGIFGVEPIRTPVTSKLWDFQRDRTYIETGYNELDYVGFMDEPWLAREIMNDQREAEANRQAVNAERRRLREAHRKSRSALGRQEAGAATTATKVSQLQRSGAVISGPSSPGPELNQAVPQRRRTFGSDFGG